MTPCERWLPCPGCGSIDLFPDTIEVGTTLAWTIRCRGCDNHGPTPTVIEMAVYLWNRLPREPRKAAPPLTSKPL